MNNQFVFDSKIKTTLLGFIIVGAICLGATFMMDSARGWTNLLQNAVMFTGVAFISLFSVSAFTTAYAGWYVQFKRLFESYYLFLPIGLILLLIVAGGVWGHMHHMYHWADETLLQPGTEAFDKVLYGKSGFLNKYVYTFGTIIAVGAWIFFAFKLRALSVAEDKTGQGANFKSHRTIRFWSAVFLPIGAFSSAMLIWQWMMSIDAHWYSTMFAWYTTASWWVTALAMMILTLIFLKGRGHYQNVTEEHLHDMGKLMFAFSIFWTYLWFSQFMLIWYGNVGEETVYFFERRENYPVLFYGNLVINFVLPFLVLLRNSTKRKYGTMIFVSVMLIFGHFIDFFQMIKPGVRRGMVHHDHAAGDHAAITVDTASNADFYLEFASGWTLPGLLEIFIFLGFLALFMYNAFFRLAQAQLEPSHDPYMEESRHHHT